MKLPVEETTRRMNSYAAYKEYTDRRSRPRKKRFRLFGRTPEKALRVGGVLLILLGLGLSWWRLHPRLPQAAVVPEGLQVNQVNEVYSEKEHTWFAEGVVRNGTDSRVARVTYGLAYLNSSSDVVTQFLLDMRDLQPRESRPFRVQVAAFSPDLKREISPAQIVLQ